MALQATHSPRAEPSLAHTRLEDFPPQMELDAESMRLMRRADSCGPACFHWLQAQRIRDETKLRMLRVPCRGHGHGVDGCGHGPGRGDFAARRDRVGDGVPGASEGPDAASVFRRQLFLTSLWIDSRPAIPWLGFSTRMKSTRIKNPPRGAGLEIRDGSRAMDQ